MAKLRTYNLAIIYILLNIYPWINYCLNTVFLNIYPWMNYCLNMYCFVSCRNLFRLNGTLGMTKLRTYYNITA